MKKDKAVATQLKVAILRDRFKRNVSKQFKSVERQLEQQFEQIREIVRTGMITKYDELWSALANMEKDMEDTGAVITGNIK